MFFLHLTSSSNNFSFYIKKYTKSENVRHYYKKLLLENFEYDKNLKNFLEETTNVEFLPELNGNRFNDEKTI